MASVMSEPALPRLQDRASSDLTLKCGPRTWHLHKSVVCPQSDFFRAACKPNTFAEGRTGIVEIPETIGCWLKPDQGVRGNDPALIECVVRFFYRQDRWWYLSAGHEYILSQDFVCLYVCADQYGIPKMQQHLIAMTAALRASGRYMSFGTLAQHLYNHGMDLKDELYAYFCGSIVSKPMELTTAMQNDDSMSVAPAEITNTLLRFLALKYTRSVATGEPELIKAYAAYQRIVIEAKRTIVEHNNTSPDIRKWLPNSVASTTLVPASIATPACKCIFTPRYLRPMHPGIIHTNSYDMLESHRKLRGFARRMKIAWPDPKRLLGTFTPQAALPQLCCRKQNTSKPRRARAADLLQGEPDSRPKALPLSIPTTPQTRDSKRPHGPILKRPRPPPGVRSPSTYYSPQGGFWSTPSARKMIERFSAMWPGDQPSSAIQPLNEQHDGSETCYESCGEEL